MKWRHMKIKLYAHNVGRVFSGANFCDFQVAFFFHDSKTKSYSIVEIIQTRTHMQNLVDAIYLKRLFK